MFNELMESYKKLSLKGKREANLDELKKLVAIVESLCVENNISYREIKSNEINDSIVLEDDYLEVQYVYITYLKEVIGALLESKF